MSLHLLPCSLYETFLFTPGHQRVYQRQACVEEQSQSKVRVPEPPFPQVVQKVLPVYHPNSINACENTFRGRATKEPCEKLCDHRCFLVRVTEVEYSMKGIIFLFVVQFSSWYGTVWYGNHYHNHGAECFYHLKIIPFELSCFQKTL